MCMSNFNSVSNPQHYVAGRKYEPRRVIEDWGLSFNLGNALKYIARAGRKGDAVEDLRKAIQYLEFEIERIEMHREAWNKALENAGEIFDAFFGRRDTSCS